MRMIDEDEVGLKEKPEDTRYSKKITLKEGPGVKFHGFSQLGIYFYNCPEVGTCYNTRARTCTHTHVHPHPHTHTYAHTPNTDTNTCQIALKKNVYLLTEVFSGEDNDS